jgi:hypothetical protein
VPSHNANPLGIDAIEPDHKIIIPVTNSDVGAAADVHVVPLDVSKLPEAPGATNPTAEVPLPRSTLFAVSVAAPVPPLTTGSVPVTSEAKLTVCRPISIASTTFVPSLKTNFFTPVETATPVPVSVLNRDRVSKVVLN